MAAPGGPLLQHLRTFAAVCRQYPVSTLAPPVAVLAVLLFGVRGTQYFVFVYNFVFVFCFINKKA